MLGKSFCWRQGFVVLLKVRQSRNDFFKPTILPKNEQTNLTLLKVSQRSKVEMSFWCLQFLPKNEQKQVKLRYHSSKVEFIRSFFGRIIGLKKSLRLCLTFSRFRLCQLSWTRDALKHCFRKAYDIPCAQLLGKLYL